MAFSLAPEDHIYGSHRSHGEILAKAFSAIRQLSEDELRDHALLSRRGGAGAGREGIHGPVRELALRFFLYGTYSEISPATPA